MSKSSKAKSSCSTSKCSTTKTKTKQFKSKVNKRRTAAQTKTTKPQKPGTTLKRGQVQEGCVYQWGDTTVKVIKAVTDKNNFCTIKNQLFGACPTSKLKVANKSQVNKYLQNK